MISLAHIHAPSTVLSQYPLTTLSPIFLYTSLPHSHCKKSNGQPTSRTTAAPVYWTTGQPLGLPTTYTALDPVQGKPVSMVRYVPFPSPSLPISSLLFPSS